MIRQTRIGFRIRVASLHAIAGGISSTVVFAVIFSRDTLYIVARGELNPERVGFAQLQHRRIT